MNNIQKFAKQELDILASTVPDSIVTPFTQEILALCEAFGNSGQSGGSAPYTASAIARAVEDLMLYKPICDVTGDESEWVNVSEIDSGYYTYMWYQNNRCSALFKDGNEEKAYYLNAIVWCGKEDWDTFTGSVYIDDKNFELIGSSQFVKFPFKPKTFYIEVVYVPITEEEAENRKLHYTEDGNGECHYTILKDPKQLEKVFEYYIKKPFAANTQINCSLDKEEETEVICKCGAIIKVDNILLSTLTSAYGIDNVFIYAKCDKCNKEYNTAPEECADIISEKIKIKQALQDEPNKS